MKIRSIDDSACLHRLKVLEGKCLWRASPKQAGTLFLCSLVKQKCKTVDALLKEKEISYMMQTGKEG